jgi:GMP synthase-like glutamine amidotransferase
MRVLSIVHEPGPYGGGGLFETVAAECGREHVRWLPPDGPAPGRPRDFDAIMVFGGAMHPDQDELHPWLPGEADFIRDTLADGVPLLGVCLGSQLIARAADGSVHPADTAEIGWCEVALTEAGRADPVLGTLPEVVTAFQWHYYAWALPPGGTLLATSPAAPQAFRIGDRAWAVQFHPEVTGEMLDWWYEDGAGQLPVPVAEIAAQTHAELPAWNAHGRRLVEAFLDAAADRR